MRAHPVVLFAVGMVAGYFVGRWHMTSAKGPMGG